MTKKYAMIVGLVALAFVALMPAPKHANAWGLGNIYSGAGMYGFGNSGSLYGLGYVPVPPYFALHPPVYYGHRYFRAYGGSPFARPATVRHQISAQVVLNPFAQTQVAVELVKPTAKKPVPQKPAPKTPKAKPEKQARMIINPFYHEPESQVAGQ